jgi:hypothetical protein
VKPDRPPGLWEKATDEHAKSRSATFSVLHLPAIDANMSISGSSARRATEAIKKEINATATTRQQVRMKSIPSQNAA